LALGLAALWGTVSLVRGVLEPRLVGRQAGLPPLAAVTAFYLGFTAAGPAGMLLAPLAALALKVLHDRGVISLWR
ncbi:sporulation protein, partial [Flavonifractor sp. An92]|uniref:AI-2E family transporter n=1 Tax=Flavonifractor sp. An92 TaxID=1965666 RepID=UPI000B56FB6C